MNFKEAKGKVKSMAGGQYHLIEYELVERRDGTLVQKCSVYVEGSEYFVGESWDIAIDKLEIALRPPNTEPVEIEPIDEI